MKKLIIFLLCASLISSTCLPEQAMIRGSLVLCENIVSADEKENDGLSDSQETFTRLSDEDLLQSIENAVYEELDVEFSGTDYVIEDINSVYVSKEYLEELAYNTQSNIYYGYTLNELNELFPNQKYVFTLGENGETVVKPFESYDDAYERAVKNVVVGTGIILVNVAVSSVTGGTTNIILMASAKTATKYAFTTALFEGLASGIVTGAKTGDFQSALKTAVVKGSEGFKWGAIVGTASGSVVAFKNSKQFIGGQLYEKGKVVIDSSLKPWQKAELRTLNKYGGYYQLAYKNGKRVQLRSLGATVPDVVVNQGKKILAIEVKHYNLNNLSSRQNLYRVLEKEISDRVAHLPKNASQKIVLDVTDFNVPKELAKEVKKQILERLDKIYPNIPIEIVGAI